MALTDTTEGRLLAQWIADKGLEPYLPPIALRLLGFVNQLSRYTVVSVIALALDFAVYLTLADAGYRAAIAGVIGYSIGMLLHFGLSTRFVFKRTNVQKSDARLFSEFVVSGLAGLLITATVISLAHDTLGFTAFMAKVFAVAISFVAVFLLRRSVVFSGSRAPSTP
ncbi:MAG: GtrA family protein [Hyphomicrobium sp.]